MDKIKIRVPRKKLQDFCRKNHIRKLAFFGSVLREGFGPENDIDVLVEFEPGKTPGLTFNGVKSSRNPFRREAILSSARVVYDEG